MICSVGDAKTRWCPFARSYEVIPISKNKERPVTLNRDVEGGDSWCNCLADGCMAWRWWDVKHGYCGLAGAPGRGSGDAQVE